MQRKRRIALIPAYEPDGALLKLLNELSLAGFEIIVVDDGSGVIYSDLFQEVESKAVLLRHLNNRGKGAALKTGFSYIKKYFDEDIVIVTLDADGQHTVSDTLKICAEAEKNSAHLILGSRKLKDKVPLRSQFGNSVTRWIYWLSTGLKVHDTQTGLRAFSFEQLPRLCAIEGQRYEYEMNVLLEFARNNISITEVEIETIYINNNVASHFNIMRDSARIYGQIIKFLASSLIGFLTDYLLYLFVSLLTAGLGSTASLWISNITARVVSSNVNFLINRNFVFEAKGKLSRSAAQYFLLALAILVGNTLLLNLLVGVLAFNRYFAKLLTEVLFFSLSFFVQRLLIFRKERDRG